MTRVTSAATCRGPFASEEHPGTPEHLGHRPRVEGHHREPVGHRLEHRHCEALVVGEHDQHVGRLVVGGEFAVAEPRLEGDRIAETE